MSSLLKNYSNIKKKYPKAILLYRIGDFYETFGNDAVIISKILNIYLTKSLKMDYLAGFPFHALDAYLPKLVKAGYKVAICEELQDPKNIKINIKK